MMSMAKKCDLCGEFYDVYNAKGDGEHYNSLILTSINIYDVIIDGSDYVECCPKCMNTITQMLESLKEKPKAKTKK